MKSIYIVFIFILVSWNFAEANRLDDFARGLNPGEWVDFKDPSYTKDVTNSPHCEGFDRSTGQGATKQPEGYLTCDSKMYDEYGTAFNYAAKGYWDPQMKRLWFMGADHSAFSIKLMIYNANDNSGNGKWYGRYPFDSMRSGQHNHTYDTITMDLVQRTFLIQPHLRSEVYTTSINTQKIEDVEGTRLTAEFDRDRGAQAIEMWTFKGKRVMMQLTSTGLRSLDIYNNNAEEELIYSANATGAKDFVLGSGHQLMTHEPVNNLMIMTGGDYNESNPDTIVNGIEASRYVTAIDSNGNLMKGLDPVPLALRSEASYTHFLGTSPKDGKLCAGANGKLYATAINGGNNQERTIMWEFDPLAAKGRQWKKLPDLNWPFEGGSYICTVIPEKNVILYQSKEHIVMFKPPGAGVGIIPEPDTTPPGMPENLSVE